MYIGDAGSTYDCPLCKMSRDKSIEINLQVIYA